MGKFLNSDGKLSIKEKDLLKRIEKNKELESFFFRKVKGLKWFDALEERGYFKPNENLKPVPSQEEGYVRIPFWFVTDYLLSTAPELADENNQKYAEKFIQILVNVTVYAKENKFDNCHVWFEFSEIISQIPYESISIEHIDIVDYWLDDKYGGGGTVAKILGEKWLPGLLQSNNDKALQLAEKIIEFIYKVKFQKDDYGMRGEQSSYTRVEHYWAQEITTRIAKLAGEKIGLAVVEIFAKNLIKIIEKLKSDSWTVYWRPAIEEHRQNEQNAAEIILIDAYRDSLDGYIYANRNEALAHVKSMLESQYQTIRRLAIYAITKNDFLFKDIIDQLLNKEYLSDNYRHEMWRFLNKKYLHFSDPQKEKLLELISNIKECDREGKLHEGASTYKKTIWLSAIKEYGDREKDLYVENTRIIKTEPEHPDLLFDISAKRIIHKSPKSLEELQKLSINELVHFLKNYKDPGRFDEPGLEGLVEVFQQMTKTEPLKFYLDLDKFIKLDLAYIHGIIKAYKELVVEQARLPWNGVWQKLFEFCDAIIKQDRLWEAGSTDERFPPVANRDWIVSSIGELIEVGAKSDKYSFREDTSLDAAEKILAYLLERQEGKQYEKHSDAVLISINSPRGYCLKALIELTLHLCRIADKDNEKDHSDAWLRFQHYYDSELERADLEKPEYEFATLVGMYLPNFRYMSEPWMLANRGKIFDQANDLKWLCAMKGHVYVGVMDLDIYKYLKEHGDLLKALNDKNIRSTGINWVVQNIAITYMEGFEPLEQEKSLINELIMRSDYKVVGHLILFIWRHVEGYDNLKSKVYELWSKILQSIGLLTEDGKEVDSLTQDEKKIASRLCHWTAFVDQVDKNNLPLILAIAPYSDEIHNSYLLEFLAKISEKQLCKACEIWMEMLTKGSTAPNRPEEAVKTLLRNLVKEGVKGRQKADKIVSEYLKKGNSRVADWLNEIKNNPNPKQ